MRYTAKTLLAAPVLAVSLATSALAGPYADGFATHHGGVHAGAAYSAGWLPWKRVWVDSNKLSDRWRCHTSIGDTVYFSSARLETTAQAKLRPHAIGLMYCTNKFRHSISR